MDFDTTLSQAWADHADDPRGVAVRLPALAQACDHEPQLERVIALVHHVHGTHLGAWAEGAAALNGLQSLAAYRGDGPSGASLRRCLASLALCAGGEAASLSPSDQVRALALAAENLIAHDTVRAADLLHVALARADGSGLPATDPLHRTLAAATHNIACTLGDQPQRSADERALMILAAQASRQHWALAGTWLETERAEYRLALTWLHAGDPVQALQHAQACLAIVAANAGAALEQFFGWEARGRAERAAGEPAAHAQALAKAQVAFDALAADDQGWCRASLVALASGTEAGAPA